MISIILATLIANTAHAQSTTTAPTNPIQTSGPGVFLGYRNASNDQSVRDLGYQGSIGSYYLNTFGDGVPTLNASGSRQGCGEGLSARDGGAFQGSNPLTYTDLVTDQVDGCNGVPQMGPFCPILTQYGETTSSGLGVTNVLEVNSTIGVIWTRPTNASANFASPGAGLAMVNISSGNAVCTRPFGVNTWTANEPNWGQLGALAGSDGYSYVYANGPNFNKSAAYPNAQNNTVVLARVPKAQAFSLSAYQYYQGNGIFNSSRIYNSNLNPNSSQLLVNLISDQGSVFYSQHYGQYIYLSTYFAGAIYGRTSNTPYGPWSKTTTNVYIVPQVHDYIYAAVYQPKFSDPQGKFIVVGWSDNNYEGLANVTFA